ncbi:AroM family protein [Promicromonospora panici]|uniref:AroM family protein n=1 Tax=Promicromonospora panici TaxID=2219658 RepID=UPI00101BAE8F|nr:AroM family protein [Promicromonospora panici]
MTATPTRLGVVTIGQTPRVDLTPELAPLLPGVTLVERGVLDGCTDDEIAGFAPAPDDHALTTRLRDGRAAVIGEASVLRRLPALISELERHVDAVLLACTGPFPALAHTKPLFVPDRIIAHAVAAFAGDGGTVGVLAPLPEQAADTTAKFSRVLGAGTRVAVAAGSPYTDPEPTLRAAASRLAADGAEVIALDCFGYTAAMRDAVADASGLPVVVARSVAARLAAEVLGTGPR